MLFPLLASPLEQKLREMRFSLQVYRPRAFLGIRLWSFWVRLGCSRRPGIWGTLHFCASAMSSGRYGRLLVLTLSEHGTKCYFDSDDSGPLMTVRSRVSGDGFSEQDTK